VWRPYRPYTAEWPVLARLLVGWGAPLGAALAGWLLARGLPHPTSLLGRHPVRSLLCAGAPIAALTLVGLPFDGLPAALGGLLAGLGVVGYATLEEQGWRGYLHFDLPVDGLVARAFLVTVVWGPWHWWFLGNASVAKQAVLFVVLFASSIGIGQVARMTRSVLAAGAFHAIGNVLFLFPAIATNLSIGQKAVVLGICVTTWVAALWGLPSDPTRTMD
jgi:hypothetical protein